MTLSAFPTLKIPGFCDFFSLLTCTWCCLARDGPLQHPTWIFQREVSPLQVQGLFHTLPTAAAGKTDTSHPYIGISIYWKILGLISAGIIEE